MKLQAIILDWSIQRLLLLFCVISCGLACDSTGQEAEVQQKDSAHGEWRTAELTVVSYDDFYGAVEQQYGVPVAPQSASTRVRLGYDHTIELERTCIVNGATDESSVFAELQPCVKSENAVVGLLSRNVSLEIDFDSEGFSGYFQSQWDTQYWLFQESAEIFGGIFLGQAEELDFVRYKNAVFHVHRPNELAEDLDCSNPRRTSNFASGELWINAEGFVSLGGFNCTFDPNREGSRACKKFGPVPEGLPQLNVLQYELTQDSFQLVAEMRLPEAHFCMDIYSNELARPVD